MNSLVLRKYAGRVFLAVAAVSSLFFTVACGSNGGIIHSLGGGFSNTSLSGQYVMKQTGFVNPGSAQQFSEITIFTANGSGSLSITEDDGGPGPGPESLSGSYSIGKDGTGSLTFNYSSPTTYEITMVDDSHFYVIEADTFATSSGYGVKQTSTAAPSGTFALKAHLLDTSSRVGGITISGGALTGTQDLLTLNGAVAAPVAVTGTVTAPNANGVGNFTLNGISFSYYPVSSTEFFFMSSSGSLEIGQAEAQSATTLATGTYAFGSHGDTNASGPGGIHTAGVFTLGSGGSVTGDVDYVQDGNVQSVSISSGSYTVNGDGSGTIDLTLSNNATLSELFWMVSSSRAYFLNNNPAAVEDGSFTLQTATTLSGQAAFLMDGVDTDFKDRVGVFDTTSSTAFNWNQASNEFGVGAVALGTNGTATAGSNGRYAVTVNGVAPIVFYLSSGNSGYMVQEDGADIGGVFAAQASQ